ncbi:uncharacterized protein LOC112506028 [Cynara cardunculus var. scolymus]|uniref:uncharacterized protein LOC112506028 n=1 Tax=Cynara cardunculus var. scolymus TaxID=59895 RepID=UPI000D62B44F|nr:uncharacterized protein LOC112506028 [Cynara cardunculus var. scolymus]
MATTAALITKQQSLGKFTSGLQGGVHIIKINQAEEIAGKMLGQTLVTKQTDLQGKDDTKVYLREKIQESVLGILHNKVDQLKRMDPVILSSVMKFLDGYTASESDTIGLLAKRLPELFIDKIDMSARLFNSLKLESPSIRLIVQEATNSLAVAYKDAPITCMMGFYFQQLVTNMAAQSSSVSEMDVNLLKFHNTDMYPLNTEPARPSGLRLPSPSLHFFD